MSSSIWDFELKKVKFPENTGKGWLYRTCRGDRVCITDAKKVGGLNVCGNVADGSPGAVYECKNNNFAGLDTPQPLTSQFTFFIPPMNVLSFAHFEAVVHLQCGGKNVPGYEAS